MTQEEKQLLLIDLCARLPYGVKVKGYSGKTDTLTLGDCDLVSMFYKDEDNWYCKPYLRPLSGMTEEEMIDFLQVTDLSQVSKRFIKDFKSGNFGIMVNMSNYSRNIDWLNKKMFDYRGLIGEGLAIEVTEDNNPYKDD